MTEQQVHDADANDANVQDTDATTKSQAEELDSLNDDFDSLPAKTQAEIRKLRARNAEYRKRAQENADAAKRLAELEEQNRAAEDAEKSEVERLTGERDDYKGRYEALEAKYRESRAESAFIEAAGKANARSPKTLFRAFKSDIEYDDDGNATNVADLIATLQEREPDLFRLAEGDGGKGLTSPASNDMNALIRKAAGRT